MWEEVETGLYRNKYNPDVEIVSLIGGPFSGKWNLHVDGEVVHRGTRQSCESEAWDYVEPFVPGQH